MATVPGLPDPSLPDPGMPDGELVFRRDRGARKVLARRGITLLVCAGLAALVSTPLGTPMLVIAAVLAAGAVACGAAWVLEGTFRTVARPDGVHVHRYMTRVIPWSDIAGFRVRARGHLEQVPDGTGVHAAEQRTVEAGWRGPVWSRPPDASQRPATGTIAVELVRASGHAVRLPAPVVMGDGDYEFQAKLGKLEQWRQYYAPSGRPLAH